MEITITFGRYDEIDYEYYVDEYDVIKRLVKKVLKTKEKIIEELKPLNDEETNFEEQFEYALKMCDNNLANALYDVYASFELDEWLETFMDDIEYVFRDEAIEEYYNNEADTAELEYMRTHEL